MLSALAFTIHDDVRNNDGQELNLSVASPDSCRSTSSYKTAAAVAPRQMMRMGKATNVLSWAHQIQQ